MMVFDPCFIDTRVLVKSNLCQSLRKRPNTIAPLAMWSA